MFDSCSVKMNGFIPFIFPNKQENNASYDKEHSSREQRLRSKKVYSDPKRANVFQNNLLYFQKCKELETEVSKLKRANKYLINQVLESINIIYELKRGKNPTGPQNFMMETGVQGPNSEGQKSKNPN